MANRPSKILRSEECQMAITKAVIAVAGYGTRFLPATKVQPKEMLPIVDKPVVQYLVEEAVQSGITDIILVTRAGNQALEDHFDTSIELELHLESQGNVRALEEIKRISTMARFVYVRQGKNYPYGNGTPLLCAASLVSPGEPFVYMFGDDIVRSEVPCTRQLIDVYEREKPDAVIAVQEVDPADVSRYGVPKLRPNRTPYELEAIVEKPDRASAPSNLAQIGRFVFTNKIVEVLKGIKTGRNGELWLTDAIDQLASKGRVLVHPIEGQWHTTGDPLRFLMTVVQFALDRPDIGQEFATYLRGLRLPPRDGGTGARPNGEAPTASLRRSTKGGQ
jgi:UTP--glucose-1-phosphate uridylyltransferase